MLVAQSDTQNIGFTEVDKATDGKLTEYLANKIISADANEVNFLYSVPGVSASCIVVVGAGSSTDASRSTFFNAAAAATKAIASASHTKESDLPVVFDFGQLDEQSAAAMVAGALNGGVGQDVLRKSPKLIPPTNLQFARIAEEGLSRGQIVGDAMLLTRDLVNLPANYIYPETFAKRAAEVAVRSGFELEVWDEIRLRKEGCGSLLAVAQASSRPPRLLIMRYAGTKKQQPLALVGKGVTFDSGGLSLKPSDSMITMKCDMAGAATVLGAMQAIAELKVETPVIGVVGLVENMISGSSFRLGDVLTSRVGKTIEVHNTDAEGRLVLADALDVANDQKPAQMIDLATLTGACVVALGTDIAGLMGNDQSLQQQVQRAAETSGEEVWPLPMSKHFSKQVQSKVADLKNMGDGRWGGAITAAKFLEEFVGETPWLHIDIAGPAFNDSPKPYMDAGASGALVRTLIEHAESL